MNFFEAQRKARQSTFVLHLLFLSGVGGIILVTNIFLLMVLAYYNTGELVVSPGQLMQLFAWEHFYKASGIVIAIVALGSIYKLNQLSSGGHVVAEALGGRLLPSNTSDEQERILINVVDEMAIASGIPAPPIYILDQPGINAFAAGLSYEDAVIGITKGSVELLNREELQGVIAHEFSHIFNGDMRLNLHITGLLHGILLIGLIGRGILNALDNVKVRSSRGSNNKKGGDAVGAIVLIGIGFTVIGAVGTTVGEWIKALISQQREYLADASAVQFTRYPDGIANALKKIGGHAGGSVIKTPAAGTFSHLYFSDGVKDFWDNLFSTHPPLKERILRIDPRWNGSFITPKKTTRKTARHYQPEERKRKIMQTVAVATALESIEHIGQPSPQQIDEAASILHSLPAQLQEMTKNPLSAQAVILALLCSDFHTIRERQLQLLEHTPLRLLEKTEEAFTLLKSLSHSTRLHLMQLSISSLKMMSLQQYRQFRAFAIAFIDMDDQISFFEWNLKHIVLNPLDISFALKKPTKETYNHIRDITGEVQTFLSILTRTQTLNNEKAKHFFDAATKAAGIDILRFIAFESIDYTQLDKSISLISQAKAPVRKKVLQMVVTCLSEDDNISHFDMEILHAVAATLRLPLTLRDYDS